jgi:alpha-maltose-1-phosphate synthase
MTCHVSISHPHGNPNSFQAARALAEEKWLSSFRTGIRRSERNSPQALSSLQSDSALAIKSHVMWEALSHCGRLVRSSGLTSRVNWYDILFCGHDRQVSLEIEKDLDGVYCYEDAAKWTFRAARTRRTITIYELPAGYYRGVASEIAFVRKRAPELAAFVKAEPEWKQKRKDAELHLSDIVVTASNWSRGTLDCCTIKTPTHIIMAPYGTPADEVQPKSKPISDRFTVLFAGQIGIRKGIHNLLVAWKQLDLRTARLRLAGSVNLPFEYLKQFSSVEYLGVLPRNELLAQMKLADLFVFPSVADGFGLVIGEAMACGVPVLTTTNTGGPELITNGVEGWCVPAHDVEALAERIEWAYYHRDELFEMGRNARRRAEQWTWADYRRKLIAELSPYLN